MKAYVRFDEILNMGFLLNGLSILDVKLANLVPLWRHILVTTPSHSLLQIFKDELTNIANAKFNGILNVGYILNGFKWILSFRRHYHLVEYGTMPLTFSFKWIATVIECTCKEFRGANPLLYLSL